MQPYMDSVGSPVGNTDDLCDSLSDWRAIFVLSVPVKKHNTNAQNWMRLLSAFIYQYLISDAKLHVIKHKIFYYFESSNYLSSRTRWSDEYWQWTGRDERQLSSFVLSYPISCNIERDQNGARNMSGKSLSIQRLKTLTSETSTSTP